MFRCDGKPHFLTWVLFLGTCILAGRGDVFTLFAEDVTKEKSVNVAGVDSSRGKPLTLQQSVALALQHNPRITTARKIWEAAREKVFQAKAQFGPHVHLSASHTRQGPPNSIQLGPGEQSIVIVPESRNEAILSLNHTLYAGRSIPASNRIALLGLKAAADNLENVIADVILQTKSAYYQVLRAQALRDVAEAHVKSAEEHLRVARANFEVGTVPRFDVLRSEVEVADAQQNLLQVENGVALANAAFNHALGKDVSTPVLLELLPTTGEFPLPDLEESMQLALKQRPEILAAEKNLAIAQENVKVQQAGREPALNVSATYHRQPSSGFGRDAYSWNTALALSLPVFDRGLARSRIREARDIVAENRSLLEELRQNIMLEVKQSVLNLRESKQRIDTTSKALEAAVESMRIADLRYKEDIGTQLEVNDARLALNRARTNYAQAIYDYWIGYAKWENATGQINEKDVLSVGK